MDRRGLRTPLTQKGLFIRAIAIARAEAKITLANLV